MESKYLNIGDSVRIEIRHSEACRYLKPNGKMAAGQILKVQLVGEENHAMAQLFSDDGTPYSFPVLPGEAGIYTEYGKPGEPNRYYCYPVEDGSVEQIGRGLVRDATFIPTKMHAAGTGLSHEEVQRLLEAVAKGEVVVVDEMPSPTPEQIEVFNRSQEEVE